MRTGIRSISGSAAVGHAFAVFALLAVQEAGALTVPVFCDSNPNPIGEITVNAGTGGNPARGNISGGFTSFVPGPPDTPSLAGAAAACGEHHFNWYQIVTADNQPPPGLTPPYVDVPPGGYPIEFDDTWGDDLPWYYDEYAPNPVPPGRTYIPQLQLSAQTAPNFLGFFDAPSGPDGLNLSFKTWLVSLNADGSLHGFHSGFSWDYSIPADGSLINGARGAASNIQSLRDEWFTSPNPPTAAEYGNIIGGFRTAVPLPPAVLLFVSGLGTLLGIKRRINIKV